MAALATVDDVAVVSRDVPEGEVAKVERLLEMVSANVRRYTGQTFDAVDGDTVTVCPIDGALRVPQWPVTAVSAIQDGTAVGVEAGTSGRIFRLVDGAHQAWPPGPVTVTYSHGYESIPDDIVMVVAEVAAARWNASSVNPTMITGSSSQDVAGYSESTTYRLPAESADAWSAGHKAILDRYRPSRTASVKLS